MARSRLGNVMTVLVAGALGGLLLALAALPAATLLGVGLDRVVGPYEDLPAQLRTPAGAQRSVLLASDGETVLGSFFDENRMDIPLSEVAPVMRQAIVAVEDARFYQHHGVDPRAVLRALVANRRDGAARQGASTLTMQYVRNVRKSDPNLSERERAAATETSMGRKIQEARYALAVERKLSKDEILSRYLNITYFGAGAYGVHAASQRYFGKPPAQLTLAEAALLAGLVQAPDYYDPINGDRSAALARRGYVLDRMVATGVLGADEADRARAEPLRLSPRPTTGDCTSTAAGHDDWGFFCDYFLRWWGEQPAFGATVADRQQALRRGGYRIVTSLDVDVQATALAQAVDIYPYDDPRAVPTAVVEPGTGRVLAMAVNRHYGLGANPPGQPNRPNTVNQLVAGGDDIAGYQGGSTFKLFTLLAALESGLPLATTLDAPTKIVTRYPVTGPVSCDGYWCPTNANPSWMNGRRTMWTAFGRSVNTYWVQVVQQVGADRVVDVAQRLGIRFRAAQDAELARRARTWGPFTLGVSATTPLDLANAYATVAAEGVYCDPLPVVSITDAAGRRISAGQPSCRRVLDADVARAATDAARCPVGDQSAYRRCDGGTGTALHTMLRGRPVAGKTGSSEGFATETVVAYTPQVAVAAIAANPDDPGDPVGDEVQARVLVAVGRAIETASAGLPVRAFTPPSAATALGAP
jgi:membrane peptidoglycan carboxypeptidase